MEFTGFWESHVVFSRVWKWLSTRRANPKTHGDAHFPAVSVLDMNNRYGKSRTREHPIHTRLPPTINTPVPAWHVKKGGWKRSRMSSPLFPSDRRIRETDTFSFWHTRWRWGQNWKPNFWRRTGKHKRVFLYQRNIQRRHSCKRQHTGWRINPRERIKSLKEIWAFIQPNDTTSHYYRGKSAHLCLWVDLCFPRVCRLAELLYLHLVLDAR